MPDPRLGFPFTERDTPALRARIEGDLRVVCGEVARADPRLVALALTGGFSRGEGSARGDAPLNDYDLVAFRSRPGGGALYRRLGHDLSGRVGLEVDLMPIWTRRARRVSPKLFWLDMRLGGRVILGDADALGLLPRHEATDLRRHEVARLLGNRAAGLLLALPGPGEAVDPAQADLQATKAVLAAMDAHLLAGGLYAARLRDRLDLTRGHPDHALFHRAVAWKLGAMERAPDGWWDTAARCLLRAVDATGARTTRDGFVEVLVHLARARRVARSPSQRVRLAAWQMLERSRFPDGPPGDAPWPERKAGFFAARARTLQ